MTRLSVIKTVVCNPVINTSLQTEALLCSPHIRLYNSTFDIFLFSSQSSTINFPLSAFCAALTPNWPDWTLSTLILDQNKHITIPLKGS